MKLEAFFWLAAAGAFYSYVGYPLLLAILARLRPAPSVRRADEPMTLSVVIVALNEEDAIGRKIDNCLSLDYPSELREILVASDGSTDRTEAIVEGRAREGVRLLRLPGPAGKPTALNAAVTEARGEILLLCDARQELDTGAARALVANFADATVGAVSGELLFRLGGGQGGLEGVGLYWRFEKWIRRTESRLDSTVGVTGAICAMRRALYRPLDPRTILDDVALPMSVVQAGYRVVHEPAAKAYDDAPTDPTSEYRRKVRTLAGNYQLVALRPDLLNPFRNRLFLQLVSHKLLRLAVPWCLLLMLGTSGGLAARGSWFFAALFATQCAFYLLAGLAGRLEKRGRRTPRLLSVAYSLALLNLAAGEALFGFLLGHERAAWRSPRR
jgi:biofilm PGA synthesis N-glycosyltransferase PgaC